MTKHTWRELPTRSALPLLTHTRCDKRARSLAMPCAADDWFNQTCFMCPTTTSQREHDASAPACRLGCSRQSKSRIDKDRLIFPLLASQRKLLEGIHECQRYLELVSEEWLVYAAQVQCHVSRVRGNSYHSNAGYTENKSVALNRAIEHIAINLFHFRQCDYMWIFLETRLQGSW